MSNVLVVVDMQNDFISGSLGTQEAQKIVKDVAAVISQKIKEGYEVVFTMDTHGENYLETSEGKSLPVIHCVKGSYGWLLEEQILPFAKGCKIFEKPTFASLKLFDYLKSVNPARVELVGVCTDICVVSNALGIKANLPESEIIVYGSACAGTSEENHVAALRTMESCQIKVV
jgi:nicotinamidase-related amidase